MSITDKDRETARAIVAPIAELLLDGDAATADLIAAAIAEARREGRGDLETYRLLVDRFVAGLKACGGPTDGDDPAEVVEALAKRIARETATACAVAYLCERLGFSPDYAAIIVDESRSGERKTESARDVRAILRAGGAL